MIKGGIVGGYYGISGANPVAYYYGKDQTKRVGENYTPGGTGNDRLAEFKTTADEVLDGGKRDLLILTNASDAPNIDLENAPDNSILQFPVGRHHLLFQGYSEVTGQGAFRVDLRKIQAETDDTLVTHANRMVHGQRSPHERCINSSGPTLSSLTTRKNSTSCSLSLAAVTEAIFYASRQSYEIFLTTSIR